MDHEGGKNKFHVHSLSSLDVSLFSVYLYKSFEIFQIHSLRITRGGGGDITLFKSFHFHHWQNMHVISY